MPMFYQKVRVPEIGNHSTCLRLLADLSQVLADSDTQSKTDPLSRLKFTGRHAKHHRTFLERVLALSPEERLTCCIPTDVLRSDFPDTIYVRLVDGRALLVDSDTHELMFGNDPVGWIRSGLEAISSHYFSLPPSLPNEFTACEALTLCPCEASVYDRIVTKPTIPALYTGDGFENDALLHWRSNFWMSDISAGYAKARKHLRACWLRPVPRASRPDPVYRFIQKPSALLQKEASIFRISWGMSS